MSRRVADDGATTGADLELLHQFLRGRDVACPSCSYNLRDLPGERCPECGQVIVLRLQLAEPKLAAMLTGLVGLSAGAGLNGLLLVYFLITVMVVRRSPSGMAYFFVFNAIGLLVQGGALAAWIVLWRRIRRLPPAARWLLAIGCCVMSLVNIVLFSLTIR
jgi:DNA-directed RNA polymerase subunit RPC12/RpoP